MDKISIIVPCFNEEDVVSMFYQETTKQLHRIPDIDYELLFKIMFCTVLVFLPIYDTIRIAYLSNHKYA